MNPALKARITITGAGILFVISNIIVMIILSSENPFFCINISAPDYNRLKWRDKIEDIKRNSITIY